MLQRPGFFAYVVFGLLIGAMVCANALNTMPRVDEAQAADASEPAAQFAPVVAGASLTPEPSATVDALATVEASNRATADTAGTQRAATGTAEIAGTAAARTATSDAWTATAVLDAATLRAAEQTEVALRVAILAETLTAAPPLQTQDELMRWHTQHAVETQRAVSATRDAREATQEATLDSSVYGATWLLVWGGALILLVGLGLAAWSLSYLILGQRGAQAMVTVEGPRTIPVTQGRERTQLVVDRKRAGLIAFVEAARRIAGDDATVIPPERAFVAAGHRSKAWRKLMIDELVALGLVDEPQPGNGGGTGIADDRTLADIADVLEKGSE